MTATSVPARGGTALKRDAIGLPEVLFQSITHMAPAVATALSIGAATGFALKLTPLAVVFAMVACLFTAYSIGSWGGTCRRRAACTHLIVPILGVIAMIPAIYSVIGEVTIPFLSVSIPAFSGALSYIAPIVGVWMVIGIVVFVWLWTSNRSALSRMGDVYGGDGSAER